MKRYDYIIAIDPDVDKSGVAAMDVRARSVECMALNLPELVDYLVQSRDSAALKNQSMVVVVEAGWLAETNWHIKKDDRAQKIAIIGAKVARNHKIGHQIILFCEHHKILHEEKRPLVKCWNGPDRKITQEEMTRLLTGSQVSMPKKRQNQEMRDAILLALDRSGIALRMAK